MGNTSTVGYWTLEERTAMANTSAVGYCSFEEKSAGWRSVENTEYTAGRDDAELS